MASSFHAPSTRIAALLSFAIHVLMLSTTAYYTFGTIVRSCLLVFICCRPLLAVFNESFAFQRTPRASGWALLPGRVVNELHTAAILWPLVVTDLLVGYASDLSGTGASPYAGAVVRNTVGASAAAVWWRIADHCCFHARSLGPAAAHPIESGFAVGASDDGGSVPHLVNH